METIDQYLQGEDKRDILQKVLCEVDEIDVIVIAYRLKDGAMRWVACGWRSETIGLLAMVKHDILYYEPEEMDEEDKE